VTSSTRADILAGFQGNLERVKPSFFYLMGLLLVATVMLLLPLLYVGLIVLIGYGVYYHAAHHAAIIGPATGRGVSVLVRLLVYTAPIVVGSTVVIFLLKPLSSRPRRRTKPLALKPEAEPLLFAFVERVCDAVGAARPGRIDVDCEVNASASFRQGAWSMVSNDLVLTMGLPLVAGLSLQELAGVMAHEFGHFSQAAGMRLSYLIRSISAWFTRVVYERDAWDEGLMNLSSSVDIRVAWVLYIARAFIWLTRRVLWVFMMAGHLVSGFLLRQMECDADRKSVRLAGSPAFTSTTRQIALLNIAAQGAQDNLYQFYREGRLPDDLPQLILVNLKQLPPGAEAAVTRVFKEGSTGWLDTHPCDRERVASAKRENAAGVFHSDQPAQALFRDFAKTSKKATHSYYRSIFGAGIKRQAIVPIEQLLVGQGEEVESYEALKRYFQAAFQPWRDLPLPGWGFATLRDPRQTVLNLRENRHDVEQRFRAYGAACKEYLVADKSLKAQLRADMEPFEHAAAQRLFAALELLHEPGIDLILGQAPAWRGESARLLPALRTLNGVLKATDKAGRMALSLEKILNQLVADQQNEDLYRRLRNKTLEASELLAGLKTDLDVADYPFEHGKRRFSIASYAMPGGPVPEDPVACYHALRTLVGSMYQLRARIVGRLCVFAEQVELAWGLQPLAEAE
jgi:Zn-dependent protease with chaperone function